MLYRTSAEMSCKVLDPPILIDDLFDIVKDLPGLTLDETSHRVRFVFFHDMITLMFSFYSITCTVGG